MILHNDGKLDTSHTYIISPDLSVLVPIWYFKDLLDLLQTYLDV